ncbi:MAG: DMT family transporter [Pseudomonadota bacterium]
MLYRQNALLGAALIVSAELLFATMGAAVKAASAGLPNEMIVFFRNFIATFLLLPLVLRHGGLDNLRTAVPQWHLLRAAIGLSAMYCFFYALGQLALAEGMILKMTTPLFMPLFAWLLLREQSPWVVLLAIPVGFAGVWAVLDPTGDFHIASLVGLAGGALAALAKVAIRRLGHSEPVSRTVFYFAALSSLISSVPLLWAWQTPTTAQWQLLGLLALAGTGGQLLMTRAYAIGEASRVGAFTYFSVIFGSAYGYFFWGEVLSSQFVIGALLIAAAGVLALQKR